MPFPLLLIAGAAVAGTIGVGKTIDAISTQSKANDINEDAQSVVDFAKNKMSFAKTESGESLSMLGDCKVRILNSSIRDFVNEFGKLTKVENNESIDKDFSITIDEKEIEELKELSIIASSLAKGAAGGVVSGAVTAFGAYSAAGVLASASTGTAIATLSGAAATNATLAFFGGGSIAAGGLGVAGGTAVLGGLVAAPALVILGVVASSKANANLEDARSNLAKAKAFDSEISLAVTECVSIRRGADMMNRFLISLNSIFAPLVSEMTDIINYNGTDFSLYSDEDKKTIRKAGALARSIKAILNIAILNDEGRYNSDSTNQLVSIKKESNLI